MTAAAKIVQAKGTWRLLLAVTGAAAVTMPWRTVYYSDSRGKGGRISAAQWLAAHGPFAK